MELPALTREQVRQVDRVAIEQYAMSGIVLMENAGSGAARVIDELVARGPVVILCGGGNNGGDGYVVARHLELLGWPVKILSLTDLDQLKGDARTNAVIAEKAGLEITVVRDASTIEDETFLADTVVDAMLGTGARGDLRGIYADAVSACNGSSGLRIALDIPTGLDCDSGEASIPTFEADHTITFVAPKVGFEHQAAFPYIGQLHVVPIGVPKKLLESFT